MKETNKEAFVGLTFQEAYKEMLAGKKARRHGFKGYYYVDAETGAFTIHLVRYDRATKTTTEKDITYGQLTLLVRNVVCNDWEIVEEDAGQAVATEVNAEPVAEGGLVVEEPVEDVKKTRKPRAKKAEVVATTEPELAE